jgi:YidC/Oxa1 family membrane protein insertase
MNKTKITKRIIILAVLCIAALFVFTSCGSNAVNTNDGKWKDIFGTATVDPDEELESGESSSGDESTSEESSSEDESASEESDSSFVGSPELSETDSSDTESESESAETESTEAVEIEVVEDFFSDAPHISLLMSGGVSKDDGSTAAPEGGEQIPADEKTPNNTKKEEVQVTPDKGFLDIILSAIGWVLLQINNFLQFLPFGSYIITLFIFAIVMEVAFLPFGIKQHKNSIKQAMLKPKEVAIRRKYAGRNDQATMQKLNQEIQELYQKENYNPLSGCLPMLIQLPALIVIYSVVINPLKYVLGMSNDFITFMHYYLNYHGVGTGSNTSAIALLEAIKKVGAGNEIFSVENLGQWCTNPEAVKGNIDLIFNNNLNFNLGFLNLGDVPSFKFWEFGTNISLWLLLLVPILTFVVYFFSMRINRKLSFQPTQSADEKQQACSNTMMDVMMPLMSVYITFIVPAAIGVYWMFKSILGVLKQFILTKAMPLPQFTEADYKAAEKELAGKQPKKIQKSENAGKVRSLHHIDDEDYDERGNYNPVKKEEPIETSAEETNDSKMSEGTSIKDESDKNEAKFSFRDLFKKNDKKDDK